MIERFLFRGLSDAIRRLPGAQPLQLDWTSMRILYKINFLRNHKSPDTGEDVNHIFSKRFFFELSIYSQSKYFDQLPLPKTMKDQSPKYTQDQWLLQPESLRLGEISCVLAAVAAKEIDSSNRVFASTRTSFSRARGRNPSVWCSNPSYEASK